jgi:hypothetical protein
MDKTKNQADERRKKLENVALSVNGVKRKSDEKEIVVERHGDKLIVKVK